MYKLEIDWKKKLSYCRVVVFKRDIEVIYDNIFFDDYIGVRYVIVDILNLYFGFCRLRFLLFFLISVNENVVKIGFVMY